MKLVLIFFPCPECKIGSVFAVKDKNSNKIYAYCEECDTLWKTPEDISERRYLAEEFEWGGYASLKEVKKFGWGKYIGNNNENMAEQRKAGGR